MTLPNFDLIPSLILSERFSTIHGDMTNITQFSSIESKFMRNLHSYYSSSISDFLRESEVNIIGSINKNKTSAETVIQQDNAWEIEVEILKEQLSSFSEGRIMFEYKIQRVGKRVDVVVLHKNIVFLLEFKCGDTEYRSSTYDQVYDYALDLGNFHKESHNKLLVPIMISTRAAIVTEPIVEMDQFIQAIKYRVIQPIKCNATNIAQTIQAVAEKYDQPPFDYIAWENSEYLPSETIIEMAQLMYRSHNVNDIKQKGAKKKDLTVTTEEINKIIEYSKSHNRKSICFVTGVPGAGKTLVGLNIAIQHSNAKAGEHAVFLSGNYPLVQVLQEALARDKVEQEKAKKHKISKNDALRGTSAFIQIIHKYRDSFVGNDHVPPERVAIFDEAQRAWTKEKIANFMLVRKGVADFDHSEPEFLISTMDRHSGWAVVICLVGGGQEINTGEAGLPEWFDSLRRAFPEWDVYVTPQLNDEEYRRDREWKDMISNERYDL